MRILITLLIPFFLYGANVKKTDLYNSFIKDPFNTTIQENLLNQIEKTDYRMYLETLEALKEIYIYSFNRDVEKRALSLYYNDSFPNSRNENVARDKFNKLKNRTSRSYKNLLFLYKQKKDTKELESSMRLSKGNDFLYDMLYLNITGKKDSLNEVIDYMINNTRRGVNQVNISEDTKIRAGEILAIAYYIKNDEELKKESIEIIGQENFYRFLFLISYYSNDLVYASSYVIDNLSNDNKDILDLKLDTYLIYSKNRNDNNDFMNAWYISRKGLLLHDKIEVKDEYTIGKLFELKKELNKSTEMYVEYLINKGEIEHSVRIKKEASKLLFINLI